MRKEELEAFDRELALEEEMRLYRNRAKLERAALAREEQWKLRYRDEPLIYRGIANLLRRFE